MFKFFKKTKVPTKPTVDQIVTNHKKFFEVFGKQGESRAAISTNMFANGNISAKRSVIAVYLLHTALKDLIKDLDPATLTVQQQMSLELVQDLSNHIDTCVQETLQNYIFANAESPSSERH